METRCKVDGAAAFCPVVCDACPADDACADDVDWYRKKPSKDCTGWVAKNAEKRCAYDNDAGVPAIEGCALTCGACATDDACADDAEWYRKKTHRDCAYVGENTDKYCSANFESDGGVSSLVGCPRTCGVC